MSGGQDACSGDAGAPLVCLDDDDQPRIAKFSKSLPFKSAKIGTFLKIMNKFLLEI